MKSATVSQAERPGKPALAAVYFLWISLIASIALIPQLDFLSGVAFVLVIMIWLPVWAYANWSTVTADLAATKASLAIAVIATALIGVWFKLGVDPIVDQLVDFGLVASANAFKHSNWIEFILFTISWLGLSELWHIFRRKFNILLARNDTKAD